MKKSILKIVFSSILFFTFHFLLFTSAKAQDTSHLRISLLTCTPGEELYATFGHSAIRVTDSSSVTDYVYNYGTFDFNDPDFYIKFTRGKLMYYISAADVRDFIYEYQMDNRGITEQVLNLTAAEKTALQHFLNNNSKPENKFYKYDFFFDNCTTRLRDLLKKYQDTTFTSKPVMPLGTTFRQAIYKYLDSNHQDWSKLGIDLLLGQRCDAVMTPAQMQFLPNNLMTSLDSTTHPIVLSHQDLYTFNHDSGKGVFFTPFIIFSLLLIAIAGISFIKNKYVQIALKAFDWLLFLSIGILGIILIFMWVGTDHSMTKNNFNLIWAWPTHCIIAFFTASKKVWVKKYFAFTTAILALALLAWFFLPQHLNTSLIPLVLLLIYRSSTKCIGN